MIELMACKSCSAPITPGHAFCPRCGAALNAAAQMTEPAAAGAAEPESAIEAETEPTIEPPSEPEAEAQAETEPAIEPAEAQAETEPAIEPAEAEAETEPSTEPAEAQAETEPAIEPATASVAIEPATASVAIEPAEAEAETEPAIEPAEAQAETEPALEPAEAEAETEPSTEPATASVAIEPAEAEAETEPAIEPPSESEAQGPEPAIEPAEAEAETEPTIEPPSEPEARDYWLTARGLAPSQTESPAARPAPPAFQTAQRAYLPADLPSDADDPQRATPDVAAIATVTAREAAARAAAEKVAAVLAAGEIDDEVDADRGAGPTPEPVADRGAQGSHRYLAPSATNRTLDTIGAGRPAGALAGPTRPAAGAASVASPAPVPAPAPSGVALSGRSGSFVAGTMPVSPVAPTTTWGRMKRALASIAAEPKSELVATGLTALGGAIALVAFALPWTADNGLGVGTVDIHPRPGAWAFDTAAGWPLFFIAAILLASILASGTLEELMPALAPTIRRLTEVVVPMLLGGILLGVGMLYLMLPWGYGGGIGPLMLGAALLITGSIVGLFFPAGERRD
jgi:hypothetical protein